jgi:hypothetical protein
LPLNVTIVREIVDLVRLVGEHRDGSLSSSHNTPFGIVT